MSPEEMAFMLSFLPSDISTIGVLYICPREVNMIGWWSSEKCRDDQSHSFHQPCPYRLPLASFSAAISLEQVPRIEADMLILVQVTWVLRGRLVREPRGKGMQGQHQHYWLPWCLSSTDWCWSRRCFCRMGSLATSRRGDLRIVERRWQCLRNTVDTATMMETKSTCPVGILRWLIQHSTPRANTDI